MITSLTVGKPVVPVSRLLNPDVEPKSVCEVKDWLGTPVSNTCSEVEGNEVMVEGNRPSVVK